MKTKFDLKQDLNLLPKFNIKDNILFRQVENEAVLLNTISGSYYNLGEISVLFWQALSEGKSLELVVDRVINEYDVERDRVLEDLEIFLQSLLDCNIVYLSVDPSDSQANI